MQRQLVVFLCYLWCCTLLLIVVHQFRIPWKNAAQKYKLLFFRIYILNVQKQLTDYNAMYEKHTDPCNHFPYIKFCMWDAILNSPQQRLCLLLDLPYVTDFMDMPMILWCMNMTGQKRQTPAISLCHGSLCWPSSRAAAIFCRDPFRNQSSSAESTAAPNVSIEMPFLSAGQIILHSVDCVLVVLAI